MIDLIKTSIKDSFIYSFGNIMLRISGFILLPVYLTQLSPAEYGILGLLEVTTQVLVQIFSLAMHLPLIRWYWAPEYHNKQKTIFFSTIMFSSLLAGLMLIIFLPWASTFAQFLFHDTNYANLIQLMLVSASLQIITMIPTTLARVQGKAILYTISHILNFIVSLLLTLFFILKLDMKVEGIYLAQILGYIVNILFLGRFIWQNSELNFDFTILKEMLNYSFPLALSSMASVLLTIADRYTLNILGQLSDVGVYSLGFKISNTLNVLVISSINLALTPLIYQKMEDPNNKRFYSKIMTYMTFGIMFFVLGLSLYSQEIVQLFAKDKAYWPAYRLVPILCFAIVFGMLKDLSTIGLNLKKKTKIIGLIVTIISFINVGLNFLFVSLLKTTGAALAMLLTQVIFFFVMFQAAQKQYRIPYEIQKIFKMLLLGGFLIGIGFFLFNENEPLIVRIFSKLFLIILFPIGLYLWNFYEPIEIQTIKGAWRKWRNPLNWKKNRS
ncbi:MAG TPA: oligosaccharide flippase family protein, partial [Candidatus Marinimicrobia bacterium]|nr:oligosaccharide flippase family protein [Candidatus Neomarinimicrobiota bacterium]